MTKPVPQRGTVIPDSDHVLRYIRPRHVQDDVVNGEGLLARPQEGAPSVNWLEWFDPPLENQVAGVRSLTRLSYSRNGRLARLNVGQTRRYVQEHDPNHLSLSFEHDPLDANGGWPADPSHALIRGVPVHNTPGAALVRDLLAHCVLNPLFPALP